MRARKWLTVTLSLLFFAIACLGGAACSQTKAGADTLRSSEGSEVVQQPPALKRSGNEINVTAVGDIMLGTTYPDESALPPNDGADLLTEVTPILSGADITFGNLEGPMLEGGTSSKCPPTSTRCFAFRVPPRYGKYLKDAGFDIMSLANNHANDFGPEGRASSMRILDQLGIAHTGRPGDIAYLNVKGKRIAVIAFTTYPHSYNYLDLSNARQIVSSLVKKNDLVIVSFHGGAEGAAAQHVPNGPETYLSENRGDVRQFARSMIDVGAALVLGHGPHVVRGMEVYKNHLIAYSLGNFATIGKFNLTGPQGLSLILEVNLAPDGTFAGGLIHPAVQVKPGGPRLDKYRTIIPIVRQLSQDDFGATAVKVADDGTLSAP